MLETITVNNPMDQPASSTSWMFPVTRLPSYTQEALDSPLTLRESGEHEQKRLWRKLLAPAEQTNELGRFAGYPVHTVLNHGVMALTYLISLDKRQRACLKVLHPSLSWDTIAVQRFEREIQHLEAIRHPNVVRFLKCGISCDPSRLLELPYFITEYVDGESLEVFLQPQGKMDIACVVEFGKQLAAGLAAIHAKGMIHRDIKPGNVMVRREISQVKIIDFGISREVVPNQNITTENSILGTLSYMSPQQIQGQSLCQRSDLFSLGVVLYKLVTGQVPLLGDNFFELQCNLVHQDIQPVEALRPECPPGLAHILDHLLRKNPEDRVRSAEELRSRRSVL
ncbi:MAG: serine/threonine protein kinase [Gemmataceae bacterium]